VRAQAGCFTKPERGGLFSETACWCWELNERYHSYQIRDEGSMSISIWNLEVLFDARNAARHSDREAWLGNAVRAAGCWKPRPPVNTVEDIGDGSALLEPMCGLGDRQDPRPPVEVALSMTSLMFVSATKRNPAAGGLPWLNTTAKMRWKAPVSLFAITSPSWRDTWIPLQESPAVSIT